MLIIRDKKFKYIKYLDFYHIITRIKNIFRQHFIRNIMIRILNMDFIE